MYMFIPGKSVENKFHVPGWFEDSPGRDVDVTYRLDGDELKVTVDDAWDDDIDRKELLQFLQKEGVIKSAEEWEVVKVEDTDGKTYIMDESFTTLDIKRIAQ